jgi:phosphoribosylformylglycinamidine (FGAM) synthase-like enzyme
METKLKVSSKGGLVVTLQELVDMKRIGMKYKINHRTKDLIIFRNFLNKEINQRIRRYQDGKNQKEAQKSPSEDCKPS